MIVVGIRCASSKKAHQLVAGGRSAAGLSLRAAAPPPVGRISRRGTGRTLTTAASAAATRVRALASNLNGAQDVQDLLLTFGVRNAAIPEVVRPLVVVKVGGEVITKDADNLVASLKFLNSFGLQPVVIHGGGPQLNDELAKAGVKPEYIGGHRVTDAATMAVAQRVFEAANAQLTAALRSAGLDAVPLLGGIFRAEVPTGSRLGLVGEIHTVNSGPVDALLADNRIPVLTSLGLAADGRTLNINADVAARELAVALKPMKIVYISAGGGWREEGRVVGEIDMAADYDRLANRDYTGRQGTLLKLNEMKAIVDKLPASSSVTIASASALAACLLPHRGPGTQIRRGQRINVFESIGATDATRVEACLRHASSAPAPAHARLLPPDAEIEAILAADDYSGVVVITKPLTAGQPPQQQQLPARLPQVSAFALSPLAYAEGTEAALWRALKARFPGGFSWIAPPSALPMSEAAEAVRRGGPHLISALFPPLSAPRSVGHASASAALQMTSGGAEGATACVWGGDAGASEACAQLQTVVVAAGASHAATSAPAATAPTSSSPTTTSSSSSSSSGSRGRRIRVGLLGARGFVGRELVRLIAGHPDLLVVAASSRAFKGQDALSSLGVPEAREAVEPGLRVSDLGPEQLRSGAAPDVDVWVLALPNGLCAEHEAAIDARARASGRAPPLLIDLSADQRFDETGEWVYGLPERLGAAAAIAKARKIANPGCYATGSQIALMPLLRRNSSSGSASSRVLQASSVHWDPAHVPTVFGVSGYSGAGTTPSDKNDPAALRDNLLPYSLVGHIHEREIARHCGVKVAFSPHVAPFFQGISLTVTGFVTPAPGITPASLHAEYARFYAGCPLIRVLPLGPKGVPEMPNVRTHGAHTHGVTVGGFSYDATTGRVAMVSVIDNLLKGAATQALQNINLALGLGELTGIPSGPGGTQ